MIINSSTVGMSSKHTYQSYSSTQTMNLVMKSDVAATLELSDNGKSYLTQLEEQAKERKENQKRAAQQMLESMKQERVRKAEDVKLPATEEDLQIQMLRQMLKALRYAKDGHHRHIEVEHKQMQSVNKHYSAKVGMGIGQNISIPVLDLRSEGITNTSGGSWWTRMSVSETRYTESEYTSFAATGVARTADGREISFNVELEMSRACTGFAQSLMMEEYLVTDPLVINVDNNITSVTDQKFRFDLDADGNEEEISFVGEGSGFLALDKNGDGVINDGNELFGTKSGDGFKDLAAYDQDGNGWIDEADAVFNRLKIWIRNSNGEDVLIRLKDAGVGAMYLGNADTEFQLKNAETNESNAIIRKTGVYLKENGDVGTLQHVDLVL